MTRDGKPVAGARISVHALELADARRERLVSKAPERVALATKQTDANGAFSLDSPPDPVVDVRVEAKGFAPTALRIEKNDEAGAIVLRRAEEKSGTITAGGKPVANATVAWFAGINEVVARTDEKGHYKAPDPAKWAQRLIVFHPDFAHIDEASGPFAPNAKKGLDRTLDAGIALQGRVVAADGKTAVPKARISVDGLPLATSGDDGSFTVAHAPKKWEALQARAGDLLSLRAHAKETSLTLKAVKAGSISGTVRDAKTRTPIAGAEIRLTQRMVFDAAPLSTAISDAKGNYTIASVPPGNYQMIANRPGYAVPQSSVSVVAGQSVQKALAASPMARISGSVLDENKRGVAAAAISAPPVSREQFMMVFRGAISDRPVFSGPDGRFVIRTRGDEDVQIVAAKHGFPTGRSSSFRVASGERKSGVTVTIPSGIAVSGRVSDRNGKPLSGVTIGAEEVEGGFAGPIRRVMMTTRANDDERIQTASDGSFEIRLKEGSYDIAFKREGFAPALLRNQQVNASMKPLEVTLEPGAEIAGRVVRGGTGVEGVNVTAMGADSPTVTASDGSFVLADLTPGPVMVGAMKPDEFIQQMRNVTAPARDVVIEVPAGGRIAGRVVEKGSKKPVASFQVGTSGIRGGGGMVFAGPGQMRSFTADDGSFVLENVPAGPITLVAQAPGFAEARVPSVTVEAGKTVENVEIELDRGVRVTGRVTGPDGAPVSGASVRVDNAVRMGAVRAIPGPGTNVATDANGEYTIEAIEAGERTLEFAAQGLLPQSKTVELSGREARVDVQLSAGMRVSGQVVTDAGVPVADADVMASSAAAGGFGRRTRADGSGTFQFDGLAPGRYNFTASKSGHANGVLRDFDVSAGAAVRITMSSGGVIYGRITGLTPEQLNSVTVFASSSTGNANAPADSSGNFRIEGAPTGAVRVSAELMRGFAGENRSAAAKSIQLEPGGSVQVELEFPSDTVVRGRVTRDGRPLPNAMVSFMPRGATSQTRSSSTTDESGQYSINVATGSYNVMVMDLEKFSPYSTTYDVRGSSTFDIEIRTTQLRGRVIDAATGEPVAGAAVQIRRPGNDAFMSMRQAETDAGGSFLMESVSPGTYNATATKDGYGTEAREVTVSDSGSAALEFKITRNDGVTLQVVDGRDRRPLNANVAVYDAQNRVVHEEFFRFSAGAESLRLRLAPGTYRAFVQAMGYAPRTVVVNSPSRLVVDLTPGGSLMVRSKASNSRRGRILDASGQPYYPRNPFFHLDARPGIANFQNVAPGSYTIQIIGDGDAVVDSKVVTVREGQQEQVEM